MNETDDTVKSWVDTYRSAYSRGVFYCTLRELGLYESAEITFSDIHDSLLFIGSDAFHAGLASVRFRGL